MKIGAGVIASILVVSVVTGVAAQCNLSIRPIETVKGRQIYSAPTGLKSLYFRSHMDVNTDGAGRSYHPADPRGKSVALNNIANAITAIYDAAGKQIDCTPRQGACFERYISTFEAARDAEWNPVGHPRVETHKIIPWRYDADLRRSVPCLTQEGPFKGYFVSQTSRPADPSRDECDQNRYIDSIALNTIVLPREARWTSQGIVADEYDLVAVRDRTNGHVRFAIVGDRGPASNVGEGSIALTASLSDRHLNGRETYPEIKALRRADVDYVLFPTQDVLRLAPGPLSAEKIDRLGAAAFEQWGGITRLDACRNELTSRNHY